MSHTASESLPPDTATSTRSPSRSMSWSEIAFSTWSRHNLRKWSGQKFALCRRMSITAGSRHTTHFTVGSPRSCGASRDDRPDLDDIVGIEALIARDDGVVADDQDALAIQVEAFQEHRHQHRSVHGDLSGGVAEPNEHHSMMEPRTSKRTRGWL